MKLEANEGQVLNSGEIKAKATKKEKVEIENPTIIDTSENASKEESLLSSIQIILRMNGLERSISSIRDMADLTDGEFSYSDAVSAFENLEFSANVGQSRLVLEFFKTK